VPRGYIEAYIYMVLIIALLVAVALFMAVVFGYTAYWYVRNWLSPTRTVRAKVVRKRAKHWDAFTYLESGDVSAPPSKLSSRIRGGFARLAERLRLSETSVTQGTTCYVTFAFGGKEMELAVPISSYRAVEEDMDGLLVFRGEQFKHFIPGVGD